MDKETTDLYIGNGIWDWMKSPEPVTLKVEDIYKEFPPLMWNILDYIFEDRTDLHDRIEKYKQTHKNENKSSNI